MALDERSGKTVYLLRHGQTELNAAGRLRGRVDAALDARGLAQAEALGRLFQGVPLQRVLTSPLPRAVQTATPVARAAGLAVETDDGFNDRDYGQWTGAVRDQVETCFGSIDQAPGVESWAALTQRIHRAFLAAASGSEVQTMAIVGHDATNCALLAALIPELADEPRAIPQGTGCWNKLVRDDGRWQIVVLDAGADEGYVP